MPILRMKKGLKVPRRCADGPRPASAGPRAFTAFTHEPPTHRSRQTIADLVTEDGGLTESDLSSTMGVSKPFL